jgi:hypothetical protein
MTRVTILEHEKKTITVSRESQIGIAVTLLAIVAMAVDHLMGDDPGLEDPPTFLIASGLSFALAAFLFRRIVPQAQKAVAPAEKAATDGLVCSVLAVFPGIVTIWVGLPFLLAGAGLALGLRARQERRSRRATTAIAIATLVLIAGAGAYTAQAIDKLA